MSVLQTLRDRAGALLATVVGISLLLFVVGDFFGNNNTQRRKANKYYQIAEIGNDNISYQDYDARIQNLIEIYKLSGTTNVTEELTESLRQQIWDQMIEEKVMGEELLSLGVGVSSEELDELVLGSNPHQIVRQLFTNQQTGTFDQSFLINFLKSTDVDPKAKQYWLFFEDEIVKSQTNTKLNNLISKGLYVTGAQAEFESSLTSNSADFSFILKPYGTVSDSLVTVSQGEIEKYYQLHKDDYKRSASRNMEYIEFDITPSEEDIKAIEEDITSLVDDFAATDSPVQFINLNSDVRHTETYLSADDLSEAVRDFALSRDKNKVFGPYVEDNSYKIARLIDFAQRPDSVHARHILLAGNGTKTKEQLLSEADSLIGVLKSGGDFATLATTLSSDQGSAQLGGDLGWFTEGIMVAPFNDACFENSKGDILSVESDFGVHVIEILDQAGSSTKYDMGIIEREISYSSATYQEIYSQASRFAGMNNTYEKFNSALTDAGLDKKVATDVTPDQKDIAGLAEARYLVMSLYDVEKEKSIILDRNDQAVFELGDKFIIAYCTGITEEGYSDIKDVESDIRFELLKKKKAERIIADINESTSGMTTIDEIADALNLTVQEATNINFNSFSIPGAGIEPAVISVASTSPEGTVTGPIEGNNGVYVIAVNSVEENPAVQSPELAKSRLTSNYQMRSSFEAFQALRNQLKIVDKRYKFY